MHAVRNDNNVNMAGNPKGGPKAGLHIVEGHQENGWESSSAEAEVEAAHMHRRARLVVGRRSSRGYSERPELGPGKLKDALDKAMAVRSGGTVPVAQTVHSSRLAKLQPEERNG